MTTPPPIPRPNRGFGSAFKLNFLLPGAGLIVTGHPILGYIFAGTFLLCFIGVLGLSVLGYTRYLSISLGGELLQGDHLEQIEAGFHSRWVMALMIVGVTLYAISMITLLVMRFRSKKQQSKR